MIYVSLSRNKNVKLNSNKSERWEKVLRGIRVGICVRLFHHKEKL